MKKILTTGYYQTANGQEFEAKVVEVPHPLAAFEKYYTLYIVAYGVTIKLSEEDFRERFFPDDR